MALRVEVVSRQACVVRAVTQGAEDPRLVLPLRRHDGERRGPLPDNLASPRDLKQAAGASLTNEDVVARKALGAGDMGAEELRFRVRRPLPDDAAGLRVDLNHRRPWLADAMWSVVEDLDVSIAQDGRMVLVVEV